MCITTSRQVTCDKISGNISDNISDNISIKII